MVRRLLGTGANRVKLSQLISRTNRKIIVPLYHVVSDTKLPHIDELYSVKSKAQFERDINYLLAHYKPIDLKELSSIVDNGSYDGVPVMHLTFDDGLIQIKDVIHPILKQYNIPYSIFVNSGFVDKQALFYRYKVSYIVHHIRKSQIDYQNISNALGIKINTEILLNYEYQDTPTINRIAKYLDIDWSQYLNKNRVYLNREELKELYQQGVSIGAHSIDHPNFAYIPFEEQKKQVANSIDFISQLGVAEKYFAFPFTDHNVKSELFEWMYDSMQIELSFGTAGIKEDISPRHIQRIPLEGVGNDVHKTLISEYRYYLVKRLFHKNRIVR